MRSTTYVRQTTIYLFLLCALSLAACSERAPGVCCTTDEDCDNVDLPRGSLCAEGFSCVGDHLCEPTVCLSGADCTVDLPACNLVENACLGCSTSDDCTGFAGAPVCDGVTGACRTCLLDSECASSVCEIDTGTCVNEADVIYASATAVDAASCTLADPCSLARAIETANGEVSSSLIRMLPGIYKTPISNVRSVIEIVGTDATLEGPLSPPGDIMSVTSGGTSLSIRGLVMDLTRGNAVCDGSITTNTKLNLRDVSTTTEVAGNRLRLKGCVAQMQNVRFVNSVAVEGGVTLDIDRMAIATPGVSGARFKLEVHGTNVSIRITNSIFDFAELDWWQGLDEPRANNDLTVSHSTFVNSGIVCFQPFEKTIAPPGHFENNIFAGVGLEVDQDEVSVCTFTNNVVNQPGTFPGNIEGDAMFADPAAHDFRILAGSPAVDIATSAFTTDHDFVGTPRPQGLGNDVGAFELAP